MEVVLGSVFSDIRVHLSLHSVGGVKIVVRGAYGIGQGASIVNCGSCSITAEVDGFSDCDIVNYQRWRCCHTVMASGNFERMQTIARGGRS